MKKIFPLFMLLAIISVSSCKKKKSETPAPTTTPTTNPPPSSSDYYKIGTTTYSPDKSLTGGSVDQTDDILIITTQQTNGSIIQISAFDTLYDPLTSQLTSSRTYSLATSISTWPSPSFGKATFELVENLSLPNETIWDPTSGTLTVTKNIDGTFTAAFSNVPVKINSSATTSTASGKITY